ncbi:hypothetical protein Nepgr_017065 [Nepenthes gracilis]|uniref:Uncharacterized protein n=1 Tax=Nepenthes gracilis TaxID=150966 RepID=A0AAD3XSR5_NEPGR|nr:hypothetical protein Nepgr_017065 [Nepenthes gracilis]
MFTPRKKAALMATSSTPRTESKNNALGFLRSPRNLSSVVTEKAVTLIDGPSAPPLPPPLGSLAEYSRRAVTATGYDGGNMEDWRRFKEAGLLDEAALKRKDRDAFRERLSTLKKELFDYQHNMGLLLIEKKDMNSKCEELRQGVAEAHEILKREQAAHLIAISEAEKQEENLRRALDLQKNCVFNLEGTLREMREEHAQMKVTSERTIADANAITAEIETKRLEVERKSLSADAKLADADRMISQLDRKMQELEARENILQRAHLSLTEEQEAHEDLSRKQNVLLELEGKLHEREERLCKHRRILYEKEEKLNQSERTYKLTESGLEQLQKDIDLANLEMKEREVFINGRLADLVSKEEKIGSMRSTLGLREKRLLLLEDRLNAKERVDIPKLLDEHRAIEDAKMREFELDMERKNKSVDEELKCKLYEVEQKEIKIGHMEAKLGKKEQALEKKSERVKDKEKNVEVKMKSLKEKETFMKSEEKKLEVEKKQMIAEKESLLILKDDIGKLRAEIRKQEMEIQEGSKKLKIAEEERLEHLRLQSNLKEEIEKWRHQNELLRKEIEDLKSDRLNFEKDWEALDEKISTINVKLRRIEEEKSKLERVRSSEEERLMKEKTEMEMHVKREIEAVMLEKESFAAIMTHEQLVLDEKSRNERSQMLQDFGRHGELENGIRKRQEEMEKRILERERVFEEKRLEEIRYVNQLKEIAEREKKDVESRRLQMEKEKQDVALNRKQLEEDQLETQKDIHTLGVLSRKLKDQREELINERSFFLAFLEKLKSCGTCGDFTREFILSDLQLPVMEDKEPYTFLPLTDEILKKTSNVGKNSKRSPARIDTGSSDIGKSMSLLQKCTSIFWSPNKRAEHPTANVPQDLPYSAEQPCRYMLRNLHEERTRAPDSANFPTDPSFVDADDFHAQHLKSYEILRETNTEAAASVDLSNIVGKEQEVPKVTQKSKLQSGRLKHGERLKDGVERTHSIKAVVQDAKAIIAETSKGQKLIVDEQHHNYPHLSIEGSVKFSHNEKAAGSTARKRSHSQVTKTIEGEQDADESEGGVDSVTAAGCHRRRQQTVTLALSTPGEKRYNLRRNKRRAVSVTSTQILSARVKGDKVVADNAEGAKQALPNIEHPSLATDVTTDDGNKIANSAQAPTAKSTVFSSNRMVGVKTKATNSDDIVEDDVDVETLSEEVNGTQENDDDGDSDSEEDYSSDHLGPLVSVGKSVLKFLTT